MYRNARHNLILYKSRKLEMTHCPSSAEWIWKLLHSQDGIPHSRGQQTLSGKGPTVLGVPWGLCRNHYTLLLCVTAAGNNMDTKEPMSMAGFQENFTGQPLPHSNGNEWTTTPLKNRDAAQEMLSKRRQTQKNVFWRTEEQTERAWGRLVPVIVYLVTEVAASSARFVFIHWARQLRRRHIYTHYRYFNKELY